MPKNEFNYKKNSIELWGMLKTKLCLIFEVKEKVLTSVNIENYLLEEYFSSK